MDTYSIDLKNKFFIQNGDKTYFSSSDKVCFTIYIDYIEVYLKQKDGKKLKIDKKLAKKLVNDAYVNIEIFECLKIDPEIFDLKNKNYKLKNNLLSYQSSNEIEALVKKDGQLSFIIFRDHMSKAAEHYFDYHEITPDIAQILVNCAHLRIKF